jgi:hypothetical protein
MFGGGIAISPRKREDPGQPRCIVALEHEQCVYESNLLALLGPRDANEGKYTAIKGDDIIGPFEDYDSALGAAYDRFGLGGFLVKKIERNEQVHYFSRPPHGCQRARP